MKQSLALLTSSLFALSVTSCEQVPEGSTRVGTSVEGAVVPFTPRLRACHDRSSSEEAFDPFERDGLSTPFSPPGRWSATSFHQRMPDFPYDCGFIDEAVVTIGFDVDRTGAVRFPRVIDGGEARCPSALLVEAVSHWQFTPSRAPRCGLTSTIRLSPGGPDGMIEACAETLARPGEHTASQVMICERDTFRAHKWKDQLAEREQAFPGPLPDR